MVSLQIDHTLSFRCNSLREKLNRHPLYSAIQNKNNLRIFMEHHVYAVWDFMSLIKSLQIHIAPASQPWMPPKNSRYANFINQLVLDEESDYSLTPAAKSTHASHFESYCLAMLEVDADIHPISNFIDRVNKTSFNSVVQTADIPAPAKKFMTFTFDIIKCNKPHLLAAALAYGREDLVPQLFRSLQQELQISPGKAPVLYAYLERHIQLDEQEHGSLAILMMQELCETSSVMEAEAMLVAEQALAIRLEFWDGIYAAITA